MATAMCSCGCDCIFGAVDTCLVRQITLATARNLTAVSSVGAKRWIAVPFVGQTRRRKDGQRRPPKR